MKALVQAVRSECEALERFVLTLAPSQWLLKTVFFGWTPQDEIMHLHLIDLFTLQAMTDAEGFAETVKDVRAKQAQGLELSAQMRMRFGHLAIPDLLALWRKTWTELCATLDAADSKARMPWFGPSMGIRSTASARQMEVWAHGQDIYDLLKIRRMNTDLIRNICEIGVRTFGWSFQNRKQTPPEHPPAVTLTGPSGAVWRWNESAAERVEGSAEDFALVVTHRRNIADTALIVAGEGATRWMAVAQCFAGPPETPPAPGVRAVIYK